MKTSASLDRVRELEVAVRANPDDADTALVYADALASRGDPRGELIVLQHRGLDDAANAHLAKHPELTGPLADGRVTWKHGFARRIEVGKGDAQAMLAHPSATFVRELQLDPIDVETAKQIVALPIIDQLTHLEILLDDWLESAQVIEAVAERSRPTLATFVFGAADLDGRAARGDLYMAWDDNPLVDIADLHALSAATPALSSLELRGEYLFGGLVHPALRTLTLYGDCINGMPFEYLDGEFSLPKLERLAVHLLMDEYRYPFINTLTLDRERAPGLRELSIVNPSHRYNDGVEQTVFAILAHSTLLPQLRSLTIPELDAENDDNVVEQFASRFRHLERFHVETILDEGNDLEAFEARCRARMPNITLD